MIRSVTNVANDALWLDERRHPFFPVMWLWLGLGLGFIPYEMWKTRGLFPCVATVACVLTVSTAARRAFVWLKDFPVRRVEGLQA